MQKSGQCRMSPGFKRSYGAPLEILWSRCVQLLQWRTLLCSCCCDSRAANWLETISRKTQSHVAQGHWVRSETIKHWSFLHMEDGILSRTLAFDFGCDCAEEEYAAKRERVLSVCCGNCQHVDCGTGIGELAQREQQPFCRESGGGWRKDETKMIGDWGECFLFHSALWHCWLHDLKDK